MFGFIIALSLLAFVDSIPPPIDSLKDGRIVGGYDIDISEAPYQISLLSYNRHTCGGTIIAEDLILTAAHCVFGSQPSDLEIRAGSSFQGYGGVKIKVKDIIAHKSFSMPKMDYDVALLQLAEPLKFSENIAPIDLADEGDDIEDGSITTVTGWGHLREGGGQPDTLQMVKVPKINEDECNEYYKPYYSITSRMLCAGLQNGGKDACQGDSGGPLVHNDKLAGVVSWGLGCARPNYPGVYAKVSAVRSWINENTLYLRAKSILRRMLL